jgi:hypothetical protein
MAESFCIMASGLFFLTGLLTGVWKYWCMRTSPEAVAPPYVDISHRAALMYAFSCLVLREFARLSPLPESTKTVAAAVPIAFFGSAVLLYVVHGVLRDTDNQLKKPHVLGRMRLSGALFTVFIAALVAGEVGGFLVLFVSAMRG